jgi:tripartite-type tricarboxylate transporter receptor subunit TctC
MIVAFPPGGADDATARFIQDAMQKALGKPIVIENMRSWWHGRRR